MEASRRWYRLCGVEPPWGDYGEVLLSGITGHQPRTRAGLLRLARTGPFVPPVAVVQGDLLVTDAFLAELERSPLAGFGFRPVEKDRIVRLEWDRWDLTADEPPEYPPGGEPEGYVLDRPHDPELAARIGPIWEVVIPDVRERPDADLVRDLLAIRGIHASRRAKDWLERHVGRWLCFRLTAGP